MASAGIPDIPTGTGNGTGDLDAIFNKSLGDFDGAMEGEREVIAAAGGGSAKAAGQREQGDADAVTNGGGGMPDFEADAPTGAGGSAGQQGTVGQSGAGMPGDQASQGASGQAGTGVQGAEGNVGEVGQPGSGVGKDSGSADKATVKLPDDIPVDGSGDDVVGRQIREAAIAMQESNPQAAEKLWDEYRRHTGIK